MRMLADKTPLRAIRAEIDRTYADQIAFSTPTPYPPL